MRQTSKAAGLLVILFCTLCAASCAEVIPSRGLYNYLLYVENLPQYEQVITDPVPLPTQEFYQAPQVAGFTPLIHVPFDLAQSFSGTYTQVSYEDTLYLLGQDGTMYRYPDYLGGSTLLYDRFVYGTPTELGIKSVYGSVIAPCQYETVEMRGELTLAKRNGITDIYCGNLLVKDGIKEDVKIFGNGILLYNGKLCDANLMPLMVGDSAVVSDFENGARLVSLGGMLGYDFGETQLAAQFLSAGKFNPYGYAYVVDTEGRFHIIDKSGDKLITEQSDKKPVGYDGTTVILWDETEYMLDGLDVRFHDLEFLYPIGGFLLEKTLDGRYRFFCLADEEFLAEEYKSVSLINGYYIAETTDGMFQLLTLDLQPVVENAQSISLADGILLVKQNEKYHYYTEELEL